MRIGPVADAFPTAWLTCAAAIDGGLTATLIYVLLKDRKYSNYTRRLLYEIAGLTLETGTLSTQVCFGVRNALANVSELTSPVNAYHRSHTLRSMAHIEDADERILVLHRVRCCASTANISSEVLAAGSSRSAMH
jgi:hypothetical protein